MRKWTCLGDDPDDLDKHVGLCERFGAMVKETDAGSVAALGMDLEGNIMGGVVLFNDPLTGATYGIHLTKGRGGEAAMVHIYREGDHEAALEQAAPTILGEGGRRDG